MCRDWVEKETLGVLQAVPVAAGEQPEPGARGELGAGEAGAGGGGGAGEVLREVLRVPGGEQRSGDAAAREAGAGEREGEAGR